MQKASTGGVAYTGVHAPDVVLDEVDHLYARDDTVTVFVDSMKATEQRFGLGRLVAGGLEFVLERLEVDRVGRQVDGARALSRGHGLSALPTVAF